MSEFSSWLLEMDKTGPLNQLNLKKKFFIQNFTFIYLKKNKLFSRSKKKFIILS